MVMILSNVNSDEDNTFANVNKAKKVLGLEIVEDVDEEIERQFEVFKMMLDCYKEIRGWEKMKNIFKGTRYKDARCKQIMNFNI